MPKEVATWICLASSFTIWSLKKCSSGAEWSLTKITLATFRTPILWKPPSRSKKQKILANQSRKQNCTYSIFEEWKHIPAVFHLHSVSITTCLQIDCLCFCCICIWVCSTTLTTLTTPNLSNLNKKKTPSGWQVSFLSLFGDQEDASIHVGLLEGIQ